MGTHQPAVSGYGIVGASKFAEFCLEQYGGIDGFGPVGIWSRTASHAKSFSERHGLRHYTTLEELLGDPEIGLVHVATIPGLHAEQGLAALEHGKHVLCEKPLATTVADGERMLDAAEQNGCALIVDFVMRYGPLWEPVRTVIQERVLGRLLRGQLFNCAGDAGLGATHWFWDKSLSGGIFIEHGVHFFDLLRSWLGEGRVVSAHQSFRPGTGHIDQVQCDVRFGDETTVGFYHGFYQASRLDRQELKLIFERGQLVLRGWVAGDLELHAVLDKEQIGKLGELLPDAQVETFIELDGDEGTCIRRGREEHVDAEIRLRWRSAEDKQTLYGRAVQGLMEDMLAGIRNGSHQPRLTIRDGLAALEMAAEAERMACEVPA